MREVGLEPTTPRLASQIIKVAASDLSNHLFDIRALPIELLSHIGGKGKIRTCVYGLKGLSLTLLCTTYQVALGDVYVILSTKLPSRITMNHSVVFHRGYILPYFSVFVNRFSLSFTIHLHFRFFWGNVSFSSFFLDRLLASSKKHFQLQVYPPAIIYFVSPVTSNIAPQTGQINSSPIFVI